MRTALKHTSYGRRVHVIACKRVRLKQIGIKTSFGNSWRDFVAGGNQYSLVRDSAWHKVRIPFSAFDDLDLQAVKQSFMLVADPPAAPMEVAIDKVRYQSR
ncbi:endo-1,3(4)-beta-glucanase [Xanthomonas bromi]|uniref:Endo-1,3(4)-beta-glucanase n=1 Tax=Xanthomonas bromi TaxID=56449 RepID=A0A1C3NNE8_9XANT|nr:endo-1,3(4)-beta-glucanase [Xanthomonas bromi]